MGHRSKQRRYAKGRNHSSRSLGNCPLGVIDVSHEGYGFVETDEGTFYVPANRMGGAMNGDTVEVRPRAGQRSAGHRQEAVVARVHKRAVEYVVGVLEVHDPLAAVVLRTHASSTIFLLIWRNPRRSRMGTWFWPASRAIPHRALQRWDT